MRILLIGSPVTVLGFDRVTKLPNLGLNSIAANVINKDTQIKVLDLVLAGKGSIQYLLNHLKSFNPDVIGFSCMSFQYDDTMKLARLVREYNNKIKIVIGGYHPTVDYENILKSDDSQFIDFIIRNEGEITFNLLIEQIRGSGNYQDLPSLSFRDNDKFIHNPPGNPLELNNLKLPDRGSRVFKRGFHILGNPADVVETSRGCTNRCKFCSIRQMYGTKFRKYKIERVIRDIKSARDYGARAILFSDDNIPIDAVRFEMLCKEIIQNKLNHIKYAIQASIPGFKQASGLPKLMSKAGIDICFLGIENSINNPLCGIEV